MMHSRNISGAFGSECRQALRNPWLYLAMAATLSVLIWDSYDPLWRTFTGEYPRLYDSPERYSITLMFGMVILLAPLLSGIPYSAAYVSDAASGMLRMRALRCGRLSGYISAKYKATFVSGALALGIPMAIYIVIIVMICGEYRYNPTNTSSLEKGIFAPLLIWGGAPFFALQIIECSVFGGLWACIGLAVSSWIVNKYVAVVAPFVIYYALTYLTQWLNIRVLEPGELLYLMPIFQERAFAGICILTAIPAAELMLVYIAFKRGVMRRYRDGRI